MRLLDRYLLREFLIPFGYCLTGFLIFWMSFDLFQDLPELQRDHLHFLDYVEYYLWKTPELLIIVLPVALLLALAQGAEVLILDEPTAGLDPVMVDEILRTLIEDHVSQGRTIFVSSHHLGEVEQICDWVGILEEGRLLLESRLEEIRQEFRLVIASGEGLPVAASTDIVSATTDGRFQRYVVAREAERFAAELRSQGATILEISPLGLRELFLHLVRKEDSCTPGNAGAKAAPVSSFS